ncbi:MAG: glycosyltransferase [Lentisphaeria bacterium]|nr:glycosyltransferase [Lentisphaeria bacterium]
MRILLTYNTTGTDPRFWQMDVPPNLEIHPFNISEGLPNSRLEWPHLDRLWRDRDRRLLTLYEKLARKAESFDVLFHVGAANLHPEFIQSLDLFTVGYCNDDPENSENLSAPIAGACDGSLYGNIAARFQYESWGARNHAFIPHPIFSDEIPARGQRDMLLSNQRGNDIVMCCERVYGFREKRLETLEKAFPDAQCYGKGWNRGFISEDALRSLYKRTKIGWNIHNSTGPINKRLFMLPAYGVTQVCDNKLGLGHIFDLGKEVVGFDTIAECIDLTHYYLDHSAEREEIARNGFDRLWQDYGPGKFWVYFQDTITQWQKQTDSFSPSKPINITPRGLFSEVIFKAKKRVKRHLGMGKPTDISGQQPLSPSRRYHFNENFLASRPLPDRGKELPTLGQDWPDWLCGAVSWALCPLLGDKETILVVGQELESAFKTYAPVVTDGTLSFCSSSSALFREQLCGIRKSRSEQEEIRTSNAQRPTSNVEVSREDVPRQADRASRMADTVDMAIVLGPERDSETLLRVLAFSETRADQVVMICKNKRFSAVEQIGHISGDIAPGDFSAAELYWIFKQWYRDVAILALPDPGVPCLERASLDTRRQVLVFVLKEPLGQKQIVHQANTCAS